MDLLIENEDLEGLKEAVKLEKKNVTDEDIIITKVDTLIRKKGLKVLNSSDESVDVSAKRHFNFVMSLMTSGLCSKITPVLTLQDFFETSSIEMCKRLFDNVEEHMLQFKQNTQPDATQNTILRLCNDLLRRLSRTAETSFCGRIMFFLSRFLPLAEKSGLNLMGYFNTQNITVYDEDEKESESLIAATSVNPAKEDDEMETGEITDDVKEIQVTPEMYRQFWSLQKFLSNPPLVFEKEKYAIFKKDISSVISLLTTNKLDKSSQEDEEMEKNSKRTKLASDDLFFSKYLTSPKLLSLQLNDSQLRRYFLLQCLIIFQYLVMSEGRFKTGAKKLTLNEDQLKFVNDCEDKCYKLLAETMPKGSNFSAICKKILQRETEWSNWKNNNCPDFAEKADKAAMQMYKKRVRVVFNPESRDLGTPELTNLWKHDYDILEACKSSKRKFIPSLPDFIRDPLLELDPEQQVDDEYKSVNNAAFQWRASRLLMMKSPHYLSRLPRTHDPTSKMNEYLEKIIYNTAKDIDEFKPDIEARERRELEARKKVEESLKRKLDSASNSISSACSPSADPVVSLTEDHLKQLAIELSDHVKQVAKVLDIDESVTEEALKKMDKKSYCHEILNNWAEKSRDRGSKTLLLTLISDVEVVEIATRSLKKILAEEVTL